MKPWALSIAFGILLLAGGAFAATGSISVSLNSLNPIAVGESATVTATVTASGDSASNTQVTISLPSGLTTSDSTTQSIGSLSAGGSSSKSWSVFGNSEGSYTITVTASATSITSQTANATLVVSNSGLVQATTTTAPASSLAAGGTTSFAVQFSNNGGSSSAVSYTLSYGSGLTLTSGASSGSFDLNAGGSTSRNWTFSMSGVGSQGINLSTTSTSNSVPSISYAVEGPSTGSSPGTSPTTTPATTTPTTPTTPATPTTTTPSTTEAPAEQAKTETVLPPTQVKPPELTPTLVQGILEEAGIAGVNTSEVIILSQSMPVSRSLKVEKTTSAGGNVSYSSTITVSVQNNSAQAALNVRVVEEIPKAIAQSASEIRSSVSFEVLKADPVLQFSIPRINAGETAAVEYSVERQLDVNAVSLMAPSLVVESTPEAAQPTTISAPSEKPSGGAEKPGQLPPWEWAAVAIIVIVIAIAYFYLRKR